MQIASVTVDKHPQVCAYLRENGYDYRFDPWHLLKGIRKQIRSALKDMPNENDKSMLKELGKRFIVHVYAAVEMSNGPGNFYLTPWVPIFIF